jgi:hypothetical protein
MWGRAGCCRGRAARRPAALLAAMADPDRAFDAIVVGEYERAFYGDQYAWVAPLFGHYGIQLWTLRPVGGSTSRPSTRNS